MAPDSSQNGGAGFQEESQGEGEPDHAPSFCAICRPTLAKNIGLDERARPFGDKCAWMAMPRDGWSREHPF
jgi:hypothetical protein